MKLKKYLRVICFGELAFTSLVWIWLFSVLPILEPNAIIRVTEQIMFAIFGTTSLYLAWDEVVNEG
jgi:hypothetical protein